MYFELSITNCSFSMIPSKAELSGTNPRLFLKLKIQTIDKFAPGIP